MYYYSFSPPYVLLVVGLLAALTSGAAFASTLKLIVRKWQKNGAQTSETSSLSINSIFVPFIGISGGVCLFLGSGLEIFGFPTLLAYAVGIPMTLLTGLLVWKQLGSMLAYAERQGFQALDLDSMS
ncbi:MAG: hypothetical protein VKL59_24145 [Nostocaceae cyanobacterium]|nr:hypothetical protein [Nostocaceae cyanobacterium]